MNSNTSGAILAIHGGPQAVRVQPRELWPIPREEIKRRVCKSIDEEPWSRSGAGQTLEFEQRFRDYIGCRYCLSQHNGTSTLWAAYFAVGVGPGDEVIHPAYTWICSIAPALHMGARPVFCEIDPRTLLADPNDIARRITAKTKAISIVHLYGNVCDMGPILDIARAHGLAVIEDCSHAHGAEWRGRKVGTIGDVGCFSMQGGPPTGKPLPGGEAGLIVTDSRKLYERILLFCHLNRAGVADELTDPVYRDFAPTNLGLKFRAHPWSLVAGSVFLESLDYRNNARRRYREKIYRGLADVRGLRPVAVLPQTKPAGFYGGMHMLYQPKELGGLPVGRFVEALRAEGVDMSHRGYDLTHRLKLFAEGFDIYGKGGPLTGDYPGYPAGSLPVSEEVHERILGMPTFIEETPGYSDQVLEAFRKVTGNFARLIE